jgi:hypothetical protein
MKVLQTRLGLQNLRRLDTSNGCQDHTALPSANAPFVLRAVDRSRETRPATSSAPDAAASTASHPNVRDDHDTPLLRDGMAQTCKDDLPDGASELFLQTGLDRKPQVALICPSGHRSMPVCLLDLPDLLSWCIPVEETSMRTGAIERSPKA